MSDFFSTKQLRELFSEERVGTKLNLQFFNRLTEIALDFAPLFDYLRSDKFGILYINDVTLDKIKNDFSERVVYDTLAFLLATERAKQQFSSVHTVLVTPNENFHPTNNFHKTISEILDLVATTSESIFRCQSFVSKKPCLFVEDKIHLSEKGSNKLKAMVKNCFRIIADNQ